MKTADTSLGGIALVMVGLCSAGCAAGDADPASGASDLTQASTFGLHAGVEQLALDQCDATQPGTDCYLRSANLENAYWLAFVSDAIYFDDVDAARPEEAARIQAELQRRGAKLSELVLFDSSIDGSHGVYFQVGDVGVLAFRGTRTSRPQDLLLDASLGMTDGIHSGFREGFDRLWNGVYLPSELPTPPDPTNPDAAPGTVSVRSDLYFTLMDRFPGVVDVAGRTDGREPYPFSSPPPSALYITGHSLGGALATVALHHLIAAGAAGEIEVPLHTSVYTFGTPRVGDLEFADALFEDSREAGIPYYRFVNHRDPVTAHPAMFGYHHLGASHAYDADGLFTRIHVALRDDGSAELAYGANPAGNGGLTDLGDHDTPNYLAALLALTSL